LTNQDGDGQQIHSLDSKIFLGEHTPEPLTRACFVHSPLPSKELSW